MAPFKTSYATNYWSTIIIIALSCIIFEIKQDIGRKSRFFIPPLHSFDTPVRGSTPPLGGSRWNIAIAFGVEKPEWCGFLTVQKNSTFSRFDKIPACRV